MMAKTDLVPSYGDLTLRVYFVCPHYMLVNKGVILSKKSS